ncbi:unnamed protein product [Calicophoron daubneyi]|uniref:Uncharacterized protein n=1 Tax=Calicophoron daubneyi TaxID=300641 RepID=A0AAV2TEE5_CALDB
MDLNILIFWTLASDAMISQAGFFFLTYEVRKSDLTAAVLELTRSEQMRSGNRPELNAVGFPWADAKT